MSVSKRVVVAAYERGMAQHEKGAFVEALALLEDASAQYADCTDDDAELLGSLMMGLGACHQSLHSPDMALQYYEACIEALQKQDGLRSGEECVGVISPLVNLGLLHFREGDHARALAKFKRAQRIAEQQFCTDRMVCADLYHNIAVVYDTQSDLQQALTYYGKSLRVREKFEATRQQQLMVALTKENVAMVWRDQDNHEEAIKLMHTILPIHKQHNGAESAEYGNSLFNLGLLHYDVGRLNSALAYFSKCLALRAALLGEDSPQTLLCGKYVAALQQKIHREAASRPGGYADVPECYDGGFGGGGCDSDGGSGSGRRVPRRSSVVSTQQQQQQQPQQHHHHHQQQQQPQPQPQRVSRSRSSSAGLSGGGGRGGGGGGGAYQPYTGRPQDVSSGTAGGARRGLSMSHLVRSPSPHGRNSSFGSSHHR